MAQSKSEQVLQSLFDLLQARLSGVTVERNSTFPERIPDGGLVILRDGDPGDPEFIFSPPTYFYEHRAEVDVLVEGADAAARDAQFDAIKVGIASALALDRSLGGLVDYALGENPTPLDLDEPGAESIKAATIGIVLPYDTADPLS